LTNYVFIFSFGVTFLIFITVIIGVIRFRKLDKSQMLIFTYCVTSLIAEVLSHFLIQKKIANVPIVNTFLVIEFFILSYFYYHLFTEKLKRDLFILVWIVAIIIVFFELVLRDINQYFSFFSLFSNLIFVLCSVFFFRKILIQQPVDIITDYYLFWFNSACFIYFSCTSIIFCLQNLPVNAFDTHHLIIFTHILFNYIFYILFAIGLCKTVQK
jgi:hypothetical protein